MNKLILILLLFFSYDLRLSGQTGKVIAFSGISGSGKSTLAKLLAQECNSMSVHEPEESQWVTQRTKYGAPTALLMLRHYWVQQFIDAHNYSLQGKTVFVDSYFLKITRYYMKKPGMDWLIPADHPYMQLLMQLFDLDMHHVPDVASSSPQRISDSRKSY